MKENCFYEIANMCNLIENREENCAYNCSVFLDIDSKEGTKKAVKYMKDSYKKECELRNNFNY